MPFKQRILFSSLNKLISVHIKPAEIARSYILVLNKKINLLNNEFIVNKIDKDLLAKKIYPTKTAQNGLNFLSKDFENQLKNFTSSFNPNFQNEIVKMFQIIYIILREPINENNLNSNIVENLFTNVLPKYKVDSLSKIKIYNKFNFKYSFIYLCIFIFTF